jgi:hypothetical protein
MTHNIAILGASGDGAGVSAFAASRFAGLDEN